MNTTLVSSSYMIEKSYVLVPPCGPAGWLVQYILTGVSADGPFPAFRSFSQSETFV